MARRMAVVKTRESTGRRPGRQGPKFTGLRLRRNPRNPAIMLIAWTTVGTLADADRLAADVVAAGLAACVQIDGPVVSHFRWEGKHERVEELRLCFKLLPDQLDGLRQRVLNAHPYDTPEWLVVRAQDVGEKYL